MQRNVLVWGIVFSLIAVLLGAFGAHALKAMVSVEKLAIFEVGVKYQMMHGMALIALSLYLHQMGTSIDQQAIKWASNFFILGTFLFSGSLYGLTGVASSQNAWASFIGPITPFGGLCFMLGWIFWAWAVLKNKVDK